MLEKGYPVYASRFLALVFMHDDDLYVYYFPNAECFRVTEIERDDCGWYELTFDVESKTPLDQMPSPFFQETMEHFDDISEASIPRTPSVGEPDDAIFEEDWELDIDTHLDQL